MQRLAWMDRAWFLCLIILVACEIRTPGVLLHGRLWAEEGSAFAQDLIGRGFVQALTYTYKGNLLILTSVPVWLALQAPIEWLAQLVTWYALGIQMVLALCVARWARAVDLPPGMTALLWMALLLLPPFYEIGANATNVQWLCCMSCLVLAMTPEERLRPGFWLVAGWMLLCGLTGVPSCILAPLFLARGALERSRPHLVAGAILSATALLQLALLHHLGAGRAFQFDPYVATVAAFTQTVWASLVEISGLRRIEMLSPGGLLAFPLGLLLGVGGVVAVVLLIRLARIGGTGRLPLALLLSGWALVTAVSFFGAIGDPHALVKPPAAMRYFALGAIAWIMLVALAARGEDRRRRALGFAVLSWIAVAACGQRYLFGQWAGYFQQGADWHQQIAACRGRGDAPCTAMIWPDVVNLEGRKWAVVLPAGAVGARLEKR